MQIKREVLSCETFVLHQAINHAIYLTSIEEFREIHSVERLIKNAIKKTPRQEVVECIKRLLPYIKETSLLRAFDFLVSSISMLSKYFTERLRQEAQEGLDLIRSRGRHVHISSKHRGVIAFPAGITYGHNKIYMYLYIPSLRRIFRIKIRFWGENEKEAEVLEKKCIELLFSKIRLRRVFIFPGLNAICPSGGPGTQETEFIEREEFEAKDLLGELLEKRPEVEIEIWKHLIENFLCSPSDLGDVLANKIPFDLTYMVPLVYRTARAYACVTALPIVVRARIDYTRQRGGITEVHLSAEEVKFKAEAIFTATTSSLGFPTEHNRWKGMECMLFLLVPLPYDDEFPPLIMAVAPTHKFKIATGPSRFLSSLSRGYPSAESVLEAIQKLKRALEEPEGFYEFIKVLKLISIVYDDGKIRSVIDAIEGAGCEAPNSPFQYCDGAEGLEDFIETAMSFTNEERLRRMLKVLEEKVRRIRAGRKFHLDIKSIWRILKEIAEIACLLKRRLTEIERVIKEEVTKSEVLLEERIIEKLSSRFVNSKHKAQALLRIIGYFGLMRDDRTQILLHYNAEKKEFENLRIIVKQPIPYAKEGRALKPKVLSFEEALKELLGEREFIEKLRRVVITLCSNVRMHEKRLLYILDGDKAKRVMNFIVKEIMSRGCKVDSIPAQVSVDSKYASIRYVNKPIKIANKLAKYYRKYYKSGIKIKRNCRLIFSVPIISPPY